jgi:hypothetical protein
MSGIISIELVAPAVYAHVDEMPLFPATTKQLEASQY